MKNNYRMEDDDIKEIQGMGDVNANLFIENLHKFYDFMEELGIEIKIKKEETKKEIKVKDIFVKIPVSVSTLKKHCKVPSPELADKEIING